MTIRQQRRCLNCGHRFEVEVFTDQEIIELRRRGRHGSPIRCPECRRTDSREGWE